MFLLDALESRVHFERLSDCLPGFGTEFVKIKTARKEEAERKEVGNERSKSQRIAHSKEQTKAMSSTSGMQGVGCLWRKGVLTRCF